MLNFPGDESQRWLVDNVAAIHPDGSDHTRIHRAQTILWGAWANAALLADRGATEDELRGYLAEYAVVNNDTLALAPAFFGPYIVAYYHGWRLLAPHVTSPGFVRRLLIDQVTLEELTPAA